ncbi:MAG: hypothetical protein JOZ69_06005 [Myxococcales bacterium]|nr:hypothetical protein [Myxococcales bacterium]
MLPLVRAARIAASAASAAIAVAGIGAGAVRLLPWLLDPAIPWRAAAPFARGLVAVALEAALLVGWPVGWALACSGAVEDGTARVLQSLGESPARTVGRLTPTGAVLALTLALAAMISGTDANAPGRTATELVAQARASCAAARSPMSYAVPFTGLAWLCAPGHEPRLAGTLPGVIAGGGNRAAMTAHGARFAGDFRAIELEDARLALPASADLPVPVAVHVRTLSVRGMAPWAHASTLPAAVRALLLVASAWGAGHLTALGMLRGAVPGRAAVIVLGAAGPVAALGVLRALERAGAGAWAFCLVPVAACGCAALCALALPLVRERLGRIAVLGAILGPILGAILGPWV